MDENQTEAVASNAELGPKPRAWVIFADNGNCRMWTTFQPHIQATADAAGLQVTNLFDKTAIDAAVDAERKRVLTEVETRLRNWRQRTMNKSGDMLGLDDFMGQDSIDDLIDFACDEFA